uniref:AGC-kinase C-terminal domain-containing protein n=1 Tax=Globodera pallida TaxID=36090 RepID=A0A183CT50_GLOPA
LNADIRGHYHKVGKRTTTATTASASCYPNPLHEMPRGHFSHDTAPNSVEYFEMDV